MSAQDPTPADRLAGTDLFQGPVPPAPEEGGRALADGAAPARSQVATEGLGALAFHLILDGQAKVTSNHTEIRTLGPGDYFGEISMIDGKPRSASVEAVDQLTTLVVPHHGVPAPGRRGAHVREEPAEPAVFADPRGRGARLTTAGREVSRRCRAPSAARGGTVGRRAASRRRRAGRGRASAHDVVLAGQRLARHQPGQGDPQHQALAHRRLPRQPAGHLDRARAAPPRSRGPAPPRRSPRARPCRRGAPSPRAEAYDARPARARRTGSRRRRR